MSQGLPGFAGLIEGHAVASEMLPIAAFSAANFSTSGVSGSPALPSLPAAATSR